MPTLRLGQQEQFSLTVQPPEFVPAAGCEVQGRPLREIARRTRYQDLTGRGQGEDPGGGVDGHAADAAAPADRDIAGVDADPDAQVHGRSRDDEGGAAAHGTGRAVEDGEEAVAGGLDLTASKPRQHRAYGL